MTVRHKCMAALCGRQVSNNGRPAQKVKPQMKQYPNTLPRVPAPAKRRAIESFLEELAASLQVPDSRYEEAEKRYKSVGDWLNRDASTLKQYNPKVYIQGSFRLGTTIKPYSEEEDYDVDLVCELDFDKASITQQELKNALGVEMKSYAERYDMKEPHPSSRCWRLDYAAGAQFHLDALPAIPDGTHQRFLLEQKGLKNLQWADTAIAITDENDISYKSRTAIWPHSNPKGYSAWFYSRMREVYELRRRAVMLTEKRASVEEIPGYKVKTPLQSVVQILKRHRDMTVDDAEVRPISIIITTLAAQAYNGENTIHEALFNILSTMDDFIEYKGGVTWIPNPTDPLENFADKWAKHPERETAFRDWLQKARKDFGEVSSMEDFKAVGEYMAPVLGRKLVESVVNKRTSTKKGLASALSLFSFLSPPHREKPRWPMALTNTVQIYEATYKRDNVGGAMARKFQSDGAAIPPNCSLVFKARTTVPEPYEVWWQVVNNGQEASFHGNLRGGFNQEISGAEGLTHNETSLYKGTHTIECFIVKNGVCMAKSGQFVVNIK